MAYTLMHKEISVLDFDLDEYGHVKQVHCVYCSDHLPVGLKDGKFAQALDYRKLNRWWMHRAIPASRDRIKAVLEELSAPSTEFLLARSWGLSLSDHYWIKPAGVELKWSQVNFFENDFSDDLGDILLGVKHSSQVNEISFMTPDAASDGWLKKKWKIIDGKRCLLKAGSGYGQQEPVNEVIASCICEKLGIPHVPYTFQIYDDGIYSVCPDFVDRNTEFVSAYQLVQTQIQPNHVSDYQHFVNCCEAMGLIGAQDFLDRMITLDYLIANTDRHYGNFGIVRNADTLVSLGFAPLFDNGTSMFSHTPTSQIKPLAATISAKPFKGTQGEQIRLVQSFAWLDCEVLQEIETLCREVLNAATFIDEERKNALSQAIAARAEKLIEFADKNRS
ncbi:HipA domain-containing protein [Emergencia sp. JLR.KK010]|uniref:HipA domain-containing protein n=1 Tax=Emergencia sp. JLR.KK010 TaxID=3114296 RepID=UPI0030CD5BFB